VTGVQTCALPIYYRTYTLVNGRWPDDALAIVLKNQQIVRGGYWLNAEEATVTFN
jgi:hypothetical protein